MKYKILCVEGSHRELEAQVSELLAEEWEPYGDLKILVLHVPEEAVFFYQVMVWR